MNIHNIFQFLSLFFSGLIAGLLFAYSISVNWGLKLLTNIEYIKSMQHINLAIQNVYFLTVFIGLLIVMPISCYFQYKINSGNSFNLMLIATIIYALGVFGVTMMFNVPLNEQLAKFSIHAASNSHINSMRQAFENPWNFYHRIRTIASIASFILVIFSVIKSK